MLIQIRRDDSVRGITIGNKVIKLSAYPDDTYIFGQDPCSIQSILATCQIFENFSSLKLNPEKSHACWIDAAKYRSDIPIHCNWVNLTKDKILTLGVYNSYDVLLAAKYNLLNLISSVKDCLNTWKCTTFLSRAYTFWENVSYTEPDDVSEILTQSLWNNKCICKGNSSLYYPCLSAKGIDKIDDIFSDSGSL